MSAIAGLWRLNGRPDAAEACSRMLAAQRLYGIHAGDQWSNGDVALGRRLMRLLPEDVSDRQPLVGATGRFVLAADVRLDNREELCSALQLAPGLCDAAILLAAFGRWQDSCLEHLVGNYAFAVWDGRERRLWLARDPLGERPLHYHRSSQLFAFASMPKGLHALPGVPYAVDEERVAEFLALIPETGTGSFFQGIEQVERGHIVCITPTSLTTQQHWRPKRHTLALHNAEEYADGVRHHLDEAVRCRLRGSGDVGCHLSAGLDSSAVTATAARLLSPTDRRVIAFTAVPREGYDGPAPRNRFNDEGVLAAETAAMYPNIEHVLIRSPGRSPLDDLDRSFLLFDRPMLNLSNAIWVNSIADAARQRGLSVLLAGDRGNVGLSYSGLHLLPELFWSGRWIRWWREAGALVAGRMRWRGALANTLGPFVPAVVWKCLLRMNGGTVNDILNYTALNPARFAELDLAARARARNLDLSYRPRKDGFSSRLWVLQRVDPGIYYKGMLGGWQIDQRNPLADVRLIEFCLTVPTDQFLRGGIQRALARRALSDRLPERVIAETRSGYQAADWHERLTAARPRLQEEIERLHGSPAAVKTLDLARIGALVEQWPQSGWHHDDTVQKYQLALLRGVSAGHFLRRAARANR